MARLEHYRENFDNVPNYQPRVRTDDGIMCNMYTGSTQILKDGKPKRSGLSLTFWSRLHPKVTDLFATFCLTDFQRDTENVPVSAYTNLDISFRAQVPLGCGLFLIRTNEVGTHAKNVAVIVHVDRSKK